MTVQSLDPVRLEAVGGGHAAPGLPRLRREDRRAAAAKLFDALGVEGFGPRREALRSTRRAARTYVVLREEVAGFPTAAEARARFAAVGRAAAALVEAVDRDSRFRGILMGYAGTGAAGFEAMLASIRGLAELGDLDWPGEAGRPRNRPLAHLIGEMKEIYSAATGRAPGVSRRNDAYGRDERHGTPGGPFFRAMQAALAMTGDTTGDEALVKAIQRHGQTDII